MLNLDGIKVYHDRVALVLPAAEEPLHVYGEGYSQEIAES